MNRRAFDDRRAWLGTLQFWSDRQITGRGRIGANLAEAFSQVNGDKRAYGQWRSANFADQDERTLFNYRIRFEVFGQRRSDGHPLVLQRLLNDKTPYESGT